MLSPVFLASLRVGVDTLRANPLRTILSTLGVIMGAGALVSVLSLGDGVEHYARRQIERTTDLQTITVAPQRFRDVDGIQVANTNVPAFTIAEADSLQRAVGQGSDVALYTLGATLAKTRADTQPSGLQLAGVTQAVWKIRGLTIEKGRLFTDAESRSGAPVVVLSRAAAH